MEKSMTTNCSFLPENISSVCIMFTYLDNNLLALEELCRDKLLKTNSGNVKLYL